METLHVVSLRALDLLDCVRYLVLQEELGEQGTPHLQGYLELRLPKLITGVKKLLGPRCHLEQRMGSQSQAIAYSKKLDTRVEGGIVIEFGQPARSKCSVDLTNSIVEGASMKDMALDFPMEFGVGMPTSN